MLCLTRSVSGLYIIGTGATRTYSDIGTGIRPFVWPREFVGLKKAAISVAKGNSSSIGHQRQAVLRVCEECSRRRPSSGAETQTTSSSPKTKQAVHPASATRSTVREAPKRSRTGTARPDHRSKTRCRLADSCPGSPARRRFCVMLGERD